MFTMSKLTKKDKIHIFEEWTLENKRGTYLSKKYGIRREKVNYLGIEGRPRRTIGQRSDLPYDYPHSKGGR